MSELTESQKRDYQKYFMERPDSGFSPERNEEVINETIQEYELKRKLSTDKYSELLKERVNAVVTYLFSTSSKYMGVEKYFGDKFLGYLQGQKIVQKIKRLQSGKEIITLEEI